MIIMFSNKEHFFIQNQARKLPVAILKLTKDLNVIWKELTILCNGLTLTSNDLTWNEMTMQRTDRKPTMISTNPTSVQLHRMPWKLKDIQASS